MWRERSWLVGSMLVRGPPMRGPMICSARWVRLGLVGSSSMARSPSWRLMTGIGSSRGSWDIRQLLFRHRRLLLLQPLHRHGRGLNLLCQGGKQVLLSDRQWERQSKRFQHLVGLLLGMRRASNMVGGGIFCSCNHHWCPSSGILFLMLFSYLVCQSITVKSCFIKPWLMLKDLKGYFGRKEVSLLMVFEWKPAKIVLRPRFSMRDHLMLKSEKSVVGYNS